MSIGAFDPAGLIGKRMPLIRLPSTKGSCIDLAKRDKRISVLYLYPRTSPPGSEPLKNWDVIPGARGCTPQSCGFRDHNSELNRLGAEVFGISTQNTAYQLEAVDRLHLPFSLLSDDKLMFAKALGLPTFEAGGQVLLRRLTMIVVDGVISNIMYPIENPENNASEVLALLSSGALLGNSSSR